MALSDTTVRRLDGVALVSPVGRIDYAGAAPLERTIEPLCADVSVAALVLDFSAVEYISSVGLRVLMVAARALRARHARLAVAALSPVVAEIFAISRFDAVLEIFPDVNAALAALAQRAPPAHGGAATPRR